VMALDRLRVRTNVILSLLFKCMLTYSFVPDAFGLGLVIPLLKSMECDHTVSDNYRAITISPCISKVFELCLNDSFQAWLRNDDVQFGFRKKKML